MIYSIKEKHVEVSNPQAVMKVCQDLLSNEDKFDQDKEHFWVIHLNTRNVIKFIDLISLGTINTTLVSPREVFTRAVAERSVNIIIAHNHPSDGVTPSEEDISTTKKLVEAGKILEIRVLDHVIVGKDSYTSFRESGLL